MCFCEGIAKWRGKSELETVSISCTSQFHWISYQIVVQKETMPANGGPTHAWGEHGDGDWTFEEGVPFVKSDSIYVLSSELAGGI